jgi:hypothetical protein
MNTYRILEGKSSGKRSLGRSKRRWTVNIKMDLGEIHCEVDGSGSGLCPMTGFGLSSVESSGCSTRELVDKICSFSSYLLTFKCTK